jgi:hypothetical protein
MTWYCLIWIYNFITIEGVECPSAWLAKKEHFVDVVFDGIATLRYGWNCSPIDVVTFPRTLVSKQMYCLFSHITCLTCVNLEAAIKGEFLLLPTLNLKFCHKNVSYISYTKKTVTHTVVLVIKKL